MHCCLGDIDTALAHARRLHPEHLPTAERRARAATDMARVLLGIGDVRRVARSCPWWSRA
ncbi:hypothetical protein [Streptomyces sp. NPDC101455]|uniref:hypothetical protein n=1 Tax=Streptomyces sp. NPDC101455 TaxID=3366142 RepID=UPI00380C70EC